MAVVDTHERTIGIVGLKERGTKLRRIDLISGFGCRMHVASAHQPIHDLAIAEKETATFARCRLPRVHDDLVPQRARKDDARALDQRPPAIAGMTMTSLPSGTAAALPPRLRASSSPMYTLTYERRAPPSSSTRDAKPVTTIDLGDHLAQGPPGCGELGLASGRIA